MLAKGTRLGIRHRAVRGIVTHHKPSYAETQSNRSFFLTVLAATATKRDAKAYIEKYQRPYNKAQRIKVKTSETLREFFTAEDGALLEVEPSLTKTSPVRVALVLLRDAADISNRQMERIADTLSQLHRLGLQPVVIVEHEDTILDGNASHVIHSHSSQVERLVRMFESLGLQSRPIQDGLFEIRADCATRKQQQKPLQNKRIVALYDSRTLKSPACRRQIPVIHAVATDRRGKRMPITADSAMKALCRAFGIRSSAVPFQRDLDRSALVVEKIIIVDKVGGIISPDRKQGSSHVYINLDQEALSLTRELATMGASPDIAERHLRNLDTCRDCLGLLGDSASAVVTTPEIAASVAGSRQHPLIHNLLTDKPMFSPSLPVTASRTPVTATTILRKGVPVHIFRDIPLTSPKIDLDKLTRLINDSFNRRLDVAAYLERLERAAGHVAAIIVAGDYDGAAIITYEHPPSSSSSSSSSTPAREDIPHAQSEPVPYLDKFAVLRAKQGAGGVADVLFNAMMRAFPHELTWRSREENPVNKWYFERAQGTLLISPTVCSPTSDSPATRWRLFWTSRPRSLARFKEYIGVAKSIQPTWLN